MSTFTERQIERRRVIGTYLGGITQVLADLDPSHPDYDQRIVDATGLLEGVDNLNDSMRRLREMGEVSEEAEQDVERQVSEFAASIARVTRTDLANESDRTR